MSSLASHQEIRHVLWIVNLAKCTKNVLLLCRKAMAEKRWRHLQQLVRIDRLSRGHCLTPADSIQFCDELVRRENASTAVALRGSDLSNEKWTV